MQLPHYHLNRSRFSGTVDCNCKVFALFHLKDKWL